MDLSPLSSRRNAQKRKSDSLPYISTLAKKPELFKKGYANIIEKKGFFVKTLKYVKRYVVLSPNRIAVWKNEESFEKNKTKLFGLTIDPQNANKPHLSFSNNEQQGLCLTYSQEPNTFVLLFDSDVESCIEWSLAFSKIPYITVNPDEFLLLNTLKVAITKQLNPSVLEFPGISETKYGDSLGYCIGNLHGQPVQVKAYVSVVDFSSGKVYAKTLLPRFDSLFKEVGFFQQVSSPCFSDYYGFYQTKNTIGVVYEHFPLGNLKTYLKKESLSFRQQWIVCSTLAKALEYLHLRSLNHQNLALENIMITDLAVFQVKLKTCDFSTEDVPARYTSPEQIASDHSDMFAFAMLLYDMCIGIPMKRLPGKGSRDDFAQQYLTGERPDIFDSETPFCSVILKCWNTDPKKRMTATQVISALKHIQKGLPTKQELIEPDPKESVSGVKDPAQQLLAVFSSPVVEWDAFAKEFQSAMGIQNREEVDCLEHIFATGDSKVELKSVKEFLKRFPSLIPNTEKTIGRFSALNSFNFEQIRTVCGDMAFFGLITTQEAENFLKAESFGNYLFRFSASSYDCCVLSCKGKNNECFHWKIKFQKENNAVQFQLDGFNRKYPTLGKLASKHSSVMNPLSQATRSNESYFVVLKRPVLRTPRNRYEQAAVSSYQYPKPETEDWQDLFSENKINSTEVILLSSVPKKAPATPSLTTFFSGIDKLTPEEVTNIVRQFEKERIEITDIPELSKQDFEAIGITSVGVITAIRTAAKPFNPNLSRKTSVESDLSSHNDSLNISQGEDSMATVRVLDDIQVGPKVYEGESGSIYKGVWKGSTVALKTFKNSNIDDMTQEILISIKADHPLVLRTFGVFSSPDIHAIVTEWMDGGNLLSLLRKRPKDLNFQLLLKPAKQIASGMCYLHSCSIIHRDLACRNIQVSGSGKDLTVKVSDFGFSAFSSQPNSSKARLPWRWSAPEAIKEENFSQASDVWSYGVLLYELFSNGSLPYHLLFNFEDLEAKLQTGYRLTPPSGVPTVVSDVMRECFQINPDHRPPFSKIQDYF